MKTSTLITVIFLLGFAGFGCDVSTEKYVTTTQHDDFLGFTNKVMWGNTLGEPFGTRFRLDLDIASVRQDNDSLPEYFLTAVSQGSGSSDSVVIEQGPSLILLVDGVRYEFQTADPGGNRMMKQIAAEHFGSLLDSYGDQSPELAYYQTSLDTLIAIASADSIRVKLFGLNRSREAFFTKLNFAHFRDFLNLRSTRPKK
jgi:hypothetical protein